MYKAWEVKTHIKTDDNMKAISLHMMILKLDLKKNVRITLTAVLCLTIVITSRHL